MQLTPTSSELYQLPSVLLTYEHFSSRFIFSHRTEKILKTFWENRLNLRKTCSLSTQIFFQTRMVVLIFCFDYCASCMNANLHLLRWQSIGQFFTCTNLQHICSNRHLSTSNLLGTGLEQWNCRQIVSKSIRRSLIRENKREITTSNNFKFT